MDIFKVDDFCALYQIFIDKIPVYQFATLVQIIQSILQSKYQQFAFLKYFELISSLDKVDELFDSVWYKWSTGNGTKHSFYYDDAVSSRIYAE